MSERRRNASRADKAEADVRELFSKRGVLDVQAEAPVYDNVDEHEYENIVKRRRADAGEITKSAEKAQHASCFTFHVDRDLLRSYTLIGTSETIFACIFISCIK
jgi:hypothetical protein